MGFLNAPSNPLRPAGKPTCVGEAQGAQARGRHASHNVHQLLAQLLHSTPAQTCPSVSDARRRGKRSESKDAKRHKTQRPALLAAASKLCSRGTAWLWVWHQPLLVLPASPPAPTPAPLSSRQPALPALRRPAPRPPPTSVMGTDSPALLIMAVQRVSTISAAPLLYSRSLPLRRTSTLAILRSEEKPYTSVAKGGGAHGWGASAAGASH